MTANVETMAYAGETPWHGLGVKIADTLTPAQILKAAGLDWKVARIPLAAVSDDGQQPVTSHFALQRSSDKSILGICGREWVPTQNEQAFKFFKEFTDAGHMTMDTAGSLRGGQLTWGLAKVKAGFTLAGGDEVNGYLLMSNPHVWGKRIRNKFTSIRVVCNNTLDMALAGKVQDGEFAMTHVREFNDEMQQKAKETMGLAKEMVQELKEKATLLSKKRYTQEGMVTWLKETLQPGDKDVLPLYKQRVKELKEDQEVNIAELFNRRANQVLEAVETQPGADLKSSKGTYWGLLNALTFVVDHKLGRSQDARLDSAWFGPNSNLKRRGMELAVEHADKYGVAA